MELQKKDIMGAIVGTVLGDAHIEQGNTNGRLSIKHSMKQKEYALFKKSIFERIKDVSFHCSETIDTVKGKQYQSFRMKSRVHPVFTRTRKLFYKDGRKIVTKSILNRLTPLGLALWYQDDGGTAFRYRKDKNGDNLIRSDGQRWVSNRAVSISTFCFTQKEHEIMRDYFKDVWDINVKIFNHHRDGNYLWFQGAEAIKLIKIVAPYIVPSLAYKIDLKYCDPPSEYLEAVRFAHQYTDHECPAS